MIRLRIGQRWKRERSAGAHSSPMDAIGLELHGIDVLTGASEESLTEIIPAWIRALVHLALDGGRFAEVSLPEAHRTLLFERSGHALTLHVVQLARPASLTRSPVTLELDELIEALTTGAKRFLVDLATASPKLLDLPALRAMRHDLRKLAAGSFAPERRRASSGFSEHVAPTGRPGFAFDLDDPTDRLRAFQNPETDALGSLLCQGNLQLELADEKRAVWKGSGALFLMTLELSRQGMDLLRAIDAEDRTLRLELAGTRPAITVDLGGGALRSASGARSADRHAVSARALAAAMFEVGVAFCAHVRARHRAQAKNAYLEQLESRCRGGLSQLRGTGADQAATAPPAPSRAAPRSRGKKERPLAPGTRLRKLRFERTFAHRGLGEEPLALHVQRTGALLVGGDRVLAFARDGELLRAQSGSRGVAVNAAGDLLCATEDRILFHGAGSEGARWFRDHDALPLGPELWNEDGVLTTLSESRSALGFDAVTGRELWRMAPPRTQRCTLSVQGARALLGTDSGELYGIDARDGYVRFRLRAPIPLRAPAVFWGKRLVATLGRGDKTLVVIADAQTGKLLASADLELRDASAPVPFAGGVLVAGEREENARVVMLGVTGKPRWQRSLHLGPGPYVVSVVDGAPLISARDGSAARLTRDGRPEWRLGTAGEPLLRTLRPAFARGVLFVPGEKVRAVDPRGGRLLAELEAGAGLRHLGVDRTLAIYLTDEEGSLFGYRLASHLAVVATPPKTKA